MERRKPSISFGGLHIARPSRLDWVIVVATIIVLLPTLMYWRTNAIQSYVEYSVGGANSFHSLLYAWQQTNFGKNNVATLWRIFPLSAYYYLFGNLLHIPAASTQSIFMGILRLTGFLSLIALLKEILKPIKVNRFAAALAGLFFVYNLYTLTYYASSYIELLPYFVMPLQLLLLIKGLRSKKLLKYSILLALVCSASFGVNLVYDAIAVALLVFYALFMVFVTKEEQILSVLKFGTYTAIATGALTIWWLLPMIYGSLSDQQTTSYVLNSETFYNLATTASNLFRNLGEWGFFSGSNGVPYYSFSSLYQDNIWVIFSGYALTALVFSGAFVFKRIEDKTHKILLFYCYALLILLIPFIGGTNATWFSKSIMGWAFTHIPYFMALRNTYKWVSLVVLLECLAFGTVLHWFLTGKAGKIRKFTPVAVLALIMINTAPIWAGSVYGSASILVSTPTYWQQAATYINTKMDPAMNRIFLLPDEFSDIFKWNGRAIQFPSSIEPDLFNTPVVQQICVGCAQYNTAQLITYIYQNIDAKNMPNLLGLLNISNILQRNDFYSSYYGGQALYNDGPLLKNSNVNLSHKFGKLDLYSIKPNAFYPSIYAPKQIIRSDSIDNTLDLFDTYNMNNKNGAFVLNKDVPGMKLDQLLNTDFYDQIFDSGNSTLHGDSAQQQIHIKTSGDYKIYKRQNADVSAYRLSYRASSNGYTLQLKRLDDPININGKTIAPIGSSVPSTSQISLSVGDSAQTIAITIASNSYLLSPQKSWETLGTVQLTSNQRNSIQAYAVSNTGTNLIQNPSFKNGVWNKYVSNCSLTNPDADISAKVVSGLPISATALDLSAKDDSACVNSPAIKNFSADMPYLLSFDYKVLTGGPPAYCVWDGSKCAVYATGNNAKGWQTFSNVIDLDSSSKQFMLYLYATKGNYPKTDILYTNVQVYRLNHIIADQQFSLPETNDNLPVVHLTTGTSSLSIPVHQNTTNLVQNGSFVDGLWDNAVGNCDNSVADAHLAQSRQHGPKNGEYNIELSAQNSIACESSASISQFKSNQGYTVSFDYRTIAGNEAWECIWNGVTCVRTDRLHTTDKNWHHFEAWFSPGNNSTVVSVYLYADGTTSPAKVEYTNVAIHAIEDNTMNIYSIKRVDVPQNKGIKLTYSRTNPTLYKVKLQDFTKGMIILQESYHPAWQAYISVPGSHEPAWKVPASDHIIANGYANAWMLDAATMPSQLAHAKTLEVSIEFTPQHWFYIGSIISSITLVAFIGYLIYAERHRRRKVKHL